MAKRIPARSSHTSKRKKKKDPTAMIILFAGVGFAFILIIVVLLNSQSTTKKSKSTAKRKIRATTNSIESKQLDQNTSTTNTQKKKTRKQRSTFSEKRSVPRQSKDTRSNANDSIEIAGNINSFSPSDLNSLPAEFTLPDSPVGEHILTDQVRFTADAECKIQLHSASYANQHGPELTRTNNKNHHWTLRSANSNKPIANIQLTNKGIIFKWDQQTNPELRTLLHNSKITFSSGTHKKTVQLRPIAEAPHIRLFGRDAEQKYSFNLKHAPDQIHWALEPTDSNQAPFNFPTVGAPTTKGPIPITESLEWEPENNTGIVKARYVWKCTTEPGRKSQESRIQIIQKKEYKIADSKWRPLTTGSLRQDWDGRLERYDNVVAGIQRKILKKKYPSGKQISTLRRMIREGMAFKDVRSFYYALPERTMRIDFRTPCGNNDTLLAQYPARQIGMRPGMGGMGSGDISKMKVGGSGASTSGKPMAQDPKSSSPNSGKSSPPARNDHSRATHSSERSNASQNDDLWTTPPGVNPWKARQEQLGKMSSGKN